jgi:hypothetical protein
VENPGQFRAEINTLCEILADRAKTWLGPIPARREVW